MEKENKMKITAWILFILFGMVFLIEVRKFIYGSMKISEFFAMLFSIPMIALSAGVIWGGLLG
jgi:hypothetical protein